jgi:hypothetical protein
MLALQASSQAFAMKNKQNQIEEVTVTVESDRKRKLDQVEKGLSDKSLELERKHPKTLAALQQQPILIRPIAMQLFYTIIKKTST